MLGVIGRETGQVRLRVAQFEELGNPHDMISVSFAGDVLWWALDYVDFEAVVRSLVDDDQGAE